MTDAEINAELDHAADRSQSAVIILLLICDSVLLACVLMV